MKNGFRIRHRIVYIEKNGRGKGGSHDGQMERKKKKREKETDRLRSEGLQ